MLLFLFSTLVVFVPDIAKGVCSGSQALTATTTENVIVEQKSSNLDCDWTITSSDYVEINVTEWSFDSCQDKLSIYDGSTDTDLLLSRLCSHGAAMIIISSGTNVHIKFTTGNTLQGQGFRMSYRAYGSSLPRCDITAHQWPNRYYLKATENPQIIMSRNYPNDYPTNTKEEWVIILPSASSSLAIVLEDINIEDSHYCGYDYLAIHKGKCATDKKIAQVCGRSLEAWTVKGKSAILIRFHSDTGITSRGFKLKYYLGTVDDPDPNTGALHTILIGLIAACLLVIFLLVAAKIYIRCFKKPKVRPNQVHLQNRRAMLETQVRQGPNGSRIRRIMTAQSIHAEMTRYLNNTTEHDSRVSTFEISTSQSSGQGLIYQNGLFRPPSYSALFNHTEDDVIPPTIPPAATDIAPPPYPGTPDSKVEGQGRSVSVTRLSPINDDSKQGGIADVETVEPPPYRPE